MTRHRALALTLTILTLLNAASLLAAPASAKVVNENTDDLPPGCEEITDEVEISVKGGTEFARDIPGVAYTFDKHSWTVPSCALVTVTFENTDDIRHQFMPHGVWPEGFFMLEVDGQRTETGSFITPAFATSIMVHCGVAQHQQKGMKAQLLVDGGVGDIPNIPTLSGIPDQTNPQNPQGSTQEIGLLDPATLMVVLLGSAGLIARRRR